MKVRRRLVSMVLLLVLLFNLSLVAFAGEDPGTIRPKSIPVNGPCGED